MQADAAALEAAKAFRAELVEKGILSEPKPRDPNFTSEVPRVKWDKRRQKYAKVVCADFLKEREHRRRLLHREGSSRGQNTGAQGEGLAPGEAHGHPGPVFHPKVPCSGVGWEQRSQQWHACSRG